MRIAFVATMADVPWGGSEVLWSKTAARALADGHEVFFSAYQWPQTPAPLQDLVDRGAIFYLRPHYQPALSARLKSRLLQLLPTGSPEVAALRKFDPDLIVVNQGGAHDVLYRDDLRELLLSGQYPYCLICHSYQDPIRLDEHARVVLVRLFQGAQQVFTISAQQANVLQRQLATCFPNNIIIQNPLNAPAKWPLPFPGTEIPTPQFASVGSLHVHSKGQDILFEALSSKRWQQRQWELNLYGEGPDQKYLQRLAQYYQIQDRVNFRGHVANSENIWSVSHVLIISSRIESGPMVLAEAMLSGRPAVATPVGLVKDWIQEGVTGFVAQASLPQALEAALDTCWSQREQWAAMGEAATAAARQRIVADPAQAFLKLIASSLNVPSAASDSC